MKKTLILMRDEREFVSKTGEIVKYFSYYVEINGIKIKMKPDDNTAKLVLDQYYSEK